MAGLLEVGGAFYGTTYYGGTNNVGTVFKLTTAGTETVLHSFGSGHDGSYPQAGLIDVGGTLYGTTHSGGRYGYGAIFKITTAGTESVLHSFGVGYDGKYPDAELIDVGGMLYGTTTFGGEYFGSSKFGFGTIFTVATSGSSYSVIHSFGGGSDGENPEAGLTYVGGTIYGTTAGGGQPQSGYGGWGTVFKVTPSGAVTVLHSFNKTDGASPYAGLVAVGRTLYGTTMQGGAVHHCDLGCGTVFKITSSGTETVLHSFGGGNDGANPEAGLIDVGGTLYGTTHGGGSVHTCTFSGGCGTLFQISTSGTESVLHNFGHGNDGANSLAGLINVSGALIGTTVYGGADSAGVVFSLTP